jgi:hypothetical protein
MSSAIFPKAKAAQECVGVVASAAAFGQLDKLLGIPATDDHIVQV